jgi:predicted PurR-regulated permease PerM
LLLALLLAALVALAFVVLRLFIVPIAWALIIAYVTWPAYRRLRRLLRGKALFSALLMTLLLAFGLVLPLLSLAIPLMHEATAYPDRILAFFTNGRESLRGFVRGIPLLGDWLQRVLDALPRQRLASGDQALEWGKQWAGELAQLLGGLGRNAAKLVFAMLTLFVVYRDGEALLMQIRRALTPLLGERVDVYLGTIGDVSRSVFYGILLTALAQGALAGIGYWAAGVPAPLLLAVVTMFFALFPFGTPLVWAPVGVFLLVSGELWAGVGLLLWGVLVVSWIDNLIRPLVISNTVRIPFLLVMFSLIGGIAAFGLIGLFIGPFVVAMLLSVWREWQRKQEAKASVAKTTDASE